MKTIKAVKSKTEKTAVATPPSSPRRKTTVKTAAKTPAKKPARVITTEVVASHAYILWEKAGRPHGRDTEFWLQAEKELKETSFAA